MRLFLFISVMLFSSLTATPAAWAQDVFLKPADQQTTPQSALPKDKTSLANQYYANCMAKDHPIMTGETKKALCACTSARISQEMAIADIQLLFENTPEGQHQRDRVLAYIYLPCMQQPSYDLILDNCVKTLEQTPGLTGAYNICQCLAHEMSQYTQEFTNTLVRQDMSHEELSQIQGKLAAFLNSDTYQQVSQRKTMECLQKFQ